MKKLITIFLLFASVTGYSQISDALLQDTIDLWIYTNASKAITAAQMNTILTHLNTNKLHKDSLDAFGHWSEASNDITNTNSRYVIIDSLFKIYPLPSNNTSKVGRILHINSSGLVQWISPYLLYEEMEDTVAEAGSVYDIWERDTTNGIVSLNYVDDFVSLGTGAMPTADRFTVYGSTLLSGGATIESGNLTVNGLLTANLGDSVYIGYDVWKSNNMDLTMGISNPNAYSGVSVYRTNSGDCWTLNAQTGKSGDVQSYLYSDYRPSGFSSIGLYSSDQDRSTTGSILTLTPDSIFVIVDTNGTRDTKIIAKPRTIDIKTNTLSIDASKLVYEDTFWDDIIFPANTSVQGNSAKPDFDYTNIGLLFPKDSTEQVIVIGQMPHKWKHESAISPHIHYIQTSANDTALWRMKYRRYDIGDAVPSWSYANSTGRAVTYSSGSIHQLVEFPNITMTGLQGSCLVEILFYRTTTTGVAADILVKQFDIHYETDKPGSDDEYPQ